VSKKQKTPRARAPARGASRRKRALEPLRNSSDEELANAIVRFHNTDGSTDTERAIVVKRQLTREQREKEEAEKIAQDIEGRIAELRSKLEQIGPSDQIADAGARAHAAWAEHFMRQVEQTSDVQERRRFALLAQNEIAGVHIITRVVPAVAAKEYFEKARDSHNLEQAWDAAVQDDGLRDEALVILRSKSNTRLSNTDLAKRLARRGLGGEDAIRKKLTHLLPKRKKK
jgi:hypothetical protein